MSEQSTASRHTGPARPSRTPDRGNVVTRFFRSIALFIAQILDELRKVVRPTREELTTYTTVVIVFVSVVMLIVFGLDTLFKAIVAWAFGSGT